MAIRGTFQTVQGEYLHAYCVYGQFLDSCVSGYEATLYNIDKKLYIYIYIIYIYYKGTAFDMRMISIRKPYL